MSGASAIAGQDPTVLAGTALVLLLAEAIKGFLGLGITFITAPMLTLFVGVPEMVTLLALPILNDFTRLAVMAEPGTGRLVARGDGPATRGLRYSDRDHAV